MEPNPAGPEFKIGSVHFSVLGPCYGWSYGPGRRSGTILQLGGHTREGAAVPELRADLPVPCLATTAISMCSEAKGSGGQ